MMEYVQEELEYLISNGAYDPRYRDMLASVIGAGQESQAVETMLHGFAHQAARIRHMMDEQLIDYSGEMVSRMWPQLCKPTPAMTLMKLAPRRGMVDTVRTLPAGTILTADAKGGQLGFTTCRELTVLPWEISNVGTSVLNGRSSVVLKVSTGGCRLDQALLPSHLSLFLGANLEHGMEIYELLFRYLRHAVLRSSQAEATAEYTLSSADIVALGFTDEEALLRTVNPHLPGIGVLLDYYRFPWRYLYVGIGQTRLMNDLAATGEFEICFEFDREISVAAASDKGMFRLYSTPVVNIFPWRSEPLVFDGMRTSVRIVPENNGSDSCQLYDITEVLSANFQQGEITRINPYHPLREDDSRQQEGVPYFYLTGRRLDEAAEIDFSLNLDGTISATKERKILSLNLLCTNKNLHQRWQDNEFVFRIEGAQELVDVSCLMPPRPVIHPPVGLAWDMTVLTVLGRAGTRLTELPGLKQMLTLLQRASCNEEEFRRHQRHLSAFRSMVCSSAVVYSHSLPVPGREFRLHVNGEGFASTGEAFLLESVLKRAYAFNAPLNSFSSLQFVLQ